MQFMCEVFRPENIGPHTQNLQFVIIFVKHNRLTRKNSIWKACRDKILRVVEWMTWS